MTRPGQDLGRSRLGIACHHHLLDVTPPGHGYHHVRGTRTTGAVFIVPVHTTSRTVECFGTGEDRRNIGTRAATTSPRDRECITTRTLSPSPIHLRTNSTTSGQGLSQGRWNRNSLNTSRTRKISEGDALSIRGESAIINHTMLVSPHIANIKIPGCLVDPTVLAGTISLRLLTYLQVPNRKIQLAGRGTSPEDDVRKVVLPVTFRETGNFITRFCTFEIIDRPTRHLVILGHRQLAIFSASVNHQDRRITMTGSK